VPGVVKEIRQQFETDLSDEQLVSAGFFAKDEVGEGNKIQPITLYGSYTTRGGGQAEPQAQQGAAERDLRPDVQPGQLPAQLARRARLGVWPRREEARGARGC
jgi:hypothetical protein